MLFLITDALTPLKSPRSANFSSVKKSLFICNFSITPALVDAKTEFTAL